MRRILTAWLFVFLLPPLAVAAPAEPQAPGPQLAREADALRQHNNASLRFQQRSRALIVRDRTLADDDSARSSLLLFCRQQGIDTLFIAAYGPVSGAWGSATPYPWRRLLLDAHRQGLQVHALTGDARWVYDQGLALGQLAEVLSLNARSGPGEGFDGILFDFPMFARLENQLPADDRTLPPSVEAIIDGLRAQEPRPESNDRTQRGTSGPGDELAGEPLPAEARADSTPRDQVAPAALEDAALLRQYLDTLAALRRYRDRRADGRPLALGVTVPAWLQAPMGWGMQIKPAVQHFIDMADYVVLHNYPGQTVDVGRVADAALAYAGETGKRALLRYDVGFPRRAAPQLLTLFGHDELLLESVVEATLERHGGTPGLSGVVIDDYHSYLWMVRGVRGWSPPGRAPGALGPSGAAPAQTGYRGW